MAAATFSWIVTLLAVIILSGIESLDCAVHGEVPNLIQTCGSRLDWIYSTRYPAPRSSGDLNCSGIIRIALGTKDWQSCPAEPDLIKCFNVSDASYGHAHICISLLQL